MSEAPGEADPPISSNHLLCIPCCPQQCPPGIQDSPLLPKEGITAMLRKPLITSSGKAQPWKDHGGSKPTSHHSTDENNGRPQEQASLEGHTARRAGGVQVPHPWLPALATGGWIITELLSCQICPPPPLWECQLLRARPCSLESKQLPPHFLSVICEVSRVGEDTPLGRWGH